LVVLAVGLVAAPLQVQVVSQGSAAPLVRAAGELRAALAADGRLAVRAEVLVPAEVAAPSVKAAATLVAQAREDYANLDPQAALTKLVGAQESLRPLLDHPGALGQLAAALRVEGLTHLFVDNGKSAARSFASAYFLDPDYSPGAGQWPPEARLAYADAIATARGASTGSLSVRVEPEIARVWIDGRDVGLGSTTLRELARGAHHLLVTCPGHTAFAAVVNVEGDGKLSQASVFLEARSGAREEAMSAFGAAFGGDSEAMVARQAAAILTAGALVLVTDDAKSRRTVAWVLDDTGARRGGSVPLGDAAAAEIAARLLGSDETPVVGPANPWYLRWYTLAAAGAVVVGGAVALAVALSQDSTDRVSFHLGDSP